MSLGRATVDDWYIDACPHHGPSMVQTEQAGHYHLAWFSAGDLHKGIFYARHNLAKAESSHIIQVDDTPGAGHPSLAQHGEELFLVWKGFNGVSTQLQLMRSTNNGESWTTTETLLTTGQASDHPLLISNDDGVYLSWSTEEYGYVFRKISHDY